MILTITPPAETKHRFRHPHELSPAISRITLRHSSPKVHGASLSALQVHPARPMSTQHRGLPPPSAMGLPEPGRGAPSVPSALGAMPAPPQQWQGAEDSMRNWLYAKAEEDKRKQEEEKTRQETLRLEQRKIEERMLRDSLQAGIPPQLIPVMFAGLSSSNLANAGLQLVSDYLLQYSQLQHQQHHDHPQQHPQQHFQSPSSPDVRRDARMIGDKPAYAAAPQPPQPLPQSTGHTLLSTPQANAIYPSPAYQQSPGGARTQAGAFYGPPTSAPASAQPTLPRLATNENHLNQPPQSSSLLAQASHSQSQQDQNSPSNIYFHHWQPPATIASSSPSGKDAPKSSPNVISGANSENTSPKKRKSTGEHKPNPPPTSATIFSSPAFSTASSTSSNGRRGSHTRDRSDASNRGYDPIGKANRQDPSSNKRARSPSQRGSTGGQPNGSRDSSKRRHQSQEPQKRDESPSQQKRPSISADDGAPKAKAPAT